MKQNIRGSYLDADYPNSGVNFACRYTCQADKMSEALEDSFLYEVFVELAEAEAASLDDPADCVAASRGLTGEDLDGIFESSQSTMMPLMGVVMTCMNEVGFDPSMMQNMPMLNQ